MIVHGPSGQKRYTLLPGLSLPQSAAETNFSWDSFHAQIAFVSGRLSAEATVSNCGQVRLKASRKFATDTFTAQVLLDLYNRFVLALGGEALAQPCEVAGTI